MDIDQEQAAGGDQHAEYLAEQKRLMRMTFEDYWARFSDKLTAAHKDPTNNPFGMSLDAFAQMRYAIFKWQAATGISPIAAEFITLFNVLYSSQTGPLANALCTRIPCTSAGLGDIENSASIKEHSKGES